MPIPERGLGRGLKAYFPESTADASNGSLAKLAVAQIVPGESQPRKSFDDASLQELALSIKNNGVVQPLIVRKTQTPQQYEIIAGERRWRAAKLAGVTELPVIIANYSDKEALIIALTENLQREDLNAMEEAEALARLRDAYSITQEELAEKLGKNRSSVANALRLLQLPEEVRSAIAVGVLSAGHGRALLSVQDTSLRQDLFNAAVAKKLSVRECEQAADYCKKTGALPQGLRGIQGRKPRQAKPQALKQIEKELRAASFPGIRINGTEERGIVRIPFNSPEELLELRQMLANAGKE
ncbi:MAG: ParB/RepB/Spo0J family partition protein [Mailhella sp.]|nr:ParB/RepB/Spo0J family partition protein [Mailhella sp.]